MTDPMHQQVTRPRPPMAIAFPKKNRTRRIYIPPLIRHGLVAFLGGCVALMTSYALRYLGY